MVVTWSLLAGLIIFIGILEENRSTRVFLDGHELDNDHLDSIGASTTASTPQLTQSTGAKHQHLNSNRIDINQHHLIQAF